ncbi:Ig-like domain-containing protein [Nocardia stercoris]|uniref:Ig-like domain repeat protein n=1 Tax=Nocardia stercoris TaxID=2483361 RepID=A0A3M2KRN9_9NOCA|nr:Ig-like domain-containing protein [Nocardia stercoris]RMI27684.1 Ig-like domain repeat protein [Nocardia stercoris]
MTHRAFTRATAGAATTLALGALTALAAGTAGAAPATVTWTNGASTYTRTISDATPTAGETVTVSTQIQRTDSTNETVDWFEDWHPDCLTYVTDSAKVTDNSGAHPVDPRTTSIMPNFVLADFSTASYKVTASTSQPVTFSAQYTVGAGCATGTALTDGIVYNSSAGTFTFNTQGPAITVTAVANSTVTLAPVAGATVGRATTLTATVAPANAGGTVSFSDGSTVLGTGTVDNTGKATFSWTPTAAGSHSITANYGGSAAAATATTTGTVTVAPATTTAPTTTTTASTTTTGTVPFDYGAMLTQVLTFLGAGSSINYHP